MKCRIARRYNPSVGTWWVIQVKFLFWWHTCNLSFKSKGDAEYFLTYSGLKSETYCETVEAEYNKTRDSVERLYNKRHYKTQTKLI